MSIPHPQPSRRRPAPVRLPRVAAAAVALMAPAFGAPASSSAAPDTWTYKTEPRLRPPKVAVHRREPGTAPGSIFIGPKTSSSSTAAAGAQAGALIVDDAGEPIWFRSNRPGERTNDFRVQEYQGRPVLTWWEGKTARGSGRGVGVIADTSYRIIKRVRAKSPYALDMHEFKLTPRGTALVTIYHPTRRDLRSVGGPRNGRVVDGIIQEIDIETGKVLFSWHSLGKIGLHESYRKRSEDRGEAWDYFHPNSIDLDTDGNYIVSARYTNSVTKISRRTGRIIWRLGGKRSDFRMGRGTRFSLAHDARRQPDGTLRVFDNSSEDVRDRSRVITLKVDERRRRVTLVRDIRHPSKVLAATQANAHLTLAGTTFVGWGSQGRHSEFDHEGRLIYDAELPDGYASYRTYRGAWRGRPAAPPAVAAEAGAAGTSVYASWNGATDVARWRVLAGDAPDALAPAGEAPKQGFETRIEIAGRPAHVAVQALDADGRVLRTSRAVRPGG